MPDTFRFVPASIEAFKRTARDIQRAYPLTLQQSQEVLAKVYGYPDLHALQEHCKTNPTPGPFPGTTEHPFIFRLRFNASTRFYEVAGKCFPKGRQTIEDLGIFQAPVTRKEMMDFEAAVDAAVKGTELIDPTTPTSDYLWFEESDQLSDPIVSTRTYHEGVFRLTRKGAVIYTAMNWLHEQVTGSQPGKGRDAAIDRLERLVYAHPNNPYPAAVWIWGVLAPYGEDDDDIPDELALELWPQAKTCRALFESVIPPKFRGVIEPKLIGNGAANKHYFAVLYWGAACAASLGHKREALAWSRRSLKFHRNDSFGARFFVEQLTKM